jgi:hypothetical protein
MYVCMYVYMYVSSSCFATDTDKGWRLANVTFKELEMEERVGGSPRKTNFYLMYVTYSDI